MRKSLPVLISLGLVGYLVWRVSPGKLVLAATELEWRLLLPATALLVAALYVWEALCFQALFSLPGRSLSYGQMARVRGVSYLAAVVNYEAGQAVAAWRVSELQQTSLMSAVSRAALMAYHDLVVLFSLGALGATLSADPRVTWLRWFYVGGLLIFLAGIAGATLLVPRTWLSRWQQSRWGAWLDAWTWRHSVTLGLLRVVYFGIFVLYAAMAFRICRIPMGHAATLGTIPLVLLGDALPSASGLGTRDTALQWLVNPERPEVLAAMSLIWSAGLMLGRFVIGLINLWWPSARENPQLPSPASA